MSLEMQTHDNVLGIKVTAFHFYETSDKGVDYQFVAKLKGGDSSLEITYHPPYRRLVPLTMKQVYRHLKYFQSVLENPAEHTFTIRQNCDGIGEDSNTWYLICPPKPTESKPQCTHCAGCPRTNGLVMGYAGGNEV